MPTTVKDMLLPTETALFLRACGKFNLRINAFEVSLHVRRSPYAADENEQVVRIKHKKSRVEKDYARHVSPNWTTLFDLDLLSGHFDLDCESLSAQLARQRAASPSSRQVSQFREFIWQGSSAGI